MIHLGPGHEALDELTDALVRFPAEQLGPRRLPALRKVGLARGHALVHPQHVVSQGTLHHVARLAGLVVEPPAIDALGPLAGRVAWRSACPDRLPLIGAVPAAAVGEALGVDRSTRPSPRPEQPRFAPRAPGLFVLSGLGSRGIAGSALGARVLAAAIAGAPMPLEADLLDAVDPARFASRAFRRAGSPPGAGS